ncbi:MAG: hypothetical protein HY291_18525 [Planctomycetes bacterium]|nr:hypothetical protein [Planctomycetota bacterium]
MSDRAIVLFKDGPPQDWRRAADILLSAAPTLSRADATRTCRFGQGMIFMPLLATEAAAVAAALAAAGMPAEPVPVKEVVLAPSAFTLLKAGALPEGLEIQTNVQGKTSVLPWSAIRLIHVSFVRPSGAKAALPDVDEQERQAEELAQTLPSPTDGLASSGVAGAAVVAGSVLIAAAAGPGLLSTLALASTAQSVSDASNMMAGPPTGPKEPELWLEIFALEPLLRLRIRRHAFSYDSLGPRRASTGRANFRLLLQEIVNNATGAARTGLTETVLAGRDPEVPKLLCEDKDLELALTALLTREKRHGLPRAKVP